MLLICSSRSAQRKKRGHENPEEWHTEYTPRGPKRYRVVDGIREYEMDMITTRGKMTAEELAELNRRRT